MQRNVEVDLSQLKLFNHSLVTCFEPESKMGEVNGISLASWSHAIRQHVDIFEAYLFAEKEIMSFIAEKGIKEIKPTILLKWLNEIHARMAKQLSQDETFPFLAGKYVETNTLRWNPDAKTEQLFVEYAAGKMTKTKAHKELVDKGFDIISINEILLLVSIHAQMARELYVNRSSYIAMKAKMPNLLGLLTIEVIVARYQDNQLTAKEKACLAKFVKICMKPSNIPQAMQAFANKLVAAWQQCDANDIDQVGQVLFQAFYELTEIHPYFNGNGRTATCLVNIILVSLGFPSILIREPHDRGNADSLYSRAIESLTVEKPDRSLFIELIKYRLLQVQENGPYRNERFDTLILLRFKVLKIREAIAALTSVEYEDKCYREMLDKDAKVMEEKYGKNWLNRDKDELSLECNQLDLPRLEEELTRQLQKNKKPTAESLRFFAASTSTETLDNHSKALAAYRAKDYQQAVTLWQSNLPLLIQTAPLSDDMITTYSNIASCYRDIGQYEEAIEAVSEGMAVCRKANNQAALLKLDTKLKGINELHSNDLAKEAKPAVSAKK